MTAQQGKSCYCPKSIKAKLNHSAQEVIWLMEAGLKPRSPGSKANDFICFDT